MQQERVKPTLKRTKYACVNCKAAKAACDSNRPCAWCIRHALQDSCVDAPRKTRTSKKICCDPSLHKNVVFKQEYKGFQLALASDFTPSTLVPVEPPLSPPTDIFPIEDFLAPGSFDFGLNNANSQPCTNCPLYQTCSKDAPQRLICATSSSPPQSPLTPEDDDDDDDCCPKLPSIPMALASHPDYCLQVPPIKHSAPSPIQPSPSPLTASPFTPSMLTPSLLTPSLLTPSPLTPSLLTPSPISPQQPASPSQSQPSTPQQTSPCQVQPRTPPSTSLSASTSSTISMSSSSSSLTSQLVVQQQQSSRCCSSIPSSAHLPPLLDDLCNCQSLVQREMAKINASLDTISALMQLQNVSLLPTATFQLPDTTFEDCNDEFAKMLGYDGRDDLLASVTVESITASTQEMMRSSGSGGGKETPKSKPKVSLTSLVPEKYVAATLRHASDLMRASSPSINQIILSSKRGDAKYFTVLIKPCGWFSYISILKQHPQVVEGLCMCGE